MTALDLRAGSTVLDLGAGLGDVALWIHDTTEANVIGVERSRRAVAAARRRATAMRVGESVRIIRGDVMAVTPTLGSAYALDSLMFGQPPAVAIAAIASRLVPPRRVFATVIVFGRSRLASVRRALEDGSLHVVSLDDVTPALVRHSRRRRSSAVRVACTVRGGVAGICPTTLVLVEETILSVLVRADLARRYRVVVESDQ